MPRFINSNYKPNLLFGTTPELVELRKDEKGNYFHQTLLQRKKLPPKKNFSLEKLLDAKVNLERVNTKIFQEKEISFTKKNRANSTKNRGLNNAE